MLFPEVLSLTPLKDNIPSAVEHNHMVHTPSLHNYRGLGKLKGSITHKTGGLSNLTERGGIKKNMDVLVGSVLLHSLDNPPHLDKDVVNSSLTASSDKQ